MAGVTPEIFKLWPEEDQNALIQTVQENVESLTAEKSSHETAIRQLDEEIRQLSNGVSGDPNATTGQQIYLNHRDQYGGDLKDLIQAGVSVVEIPAKSSEKADHEEQLEAINAQLEPQQAQLAILKQKDEGMDSDVLQAELDALYKTQQKNYQNYLNNEADVARKQNAVDATKSIIFANHGKIEGELKDAQARSALILLDYAANTEMLSKAADLLTEEELQPFLELNKKMAEAVKKDENEPNEPSEPKQGPIATPLGRKYVSMGAKLMCPFAMGGQATLVVDPSRKVMHEGKLMGNIMDTKILNIATFGMCNSIANPAVASATAAAMGVLTPMTCVPSIVTPWTPGKPNVLVGGAPALLSTDTCQCLWGGVITIVPEAPVAPSANVADADAKSDIMSDAVTTIENLLTEALRIAADKFGSHAAKLLSKAGVMSSNGIMANLGMIKKGVRFGNLAKGLKIAGSVLTYGFIAYDYLTADQSAYAQSLADAQKKHSGRIDSIDELGARGGDYLGGALKGIGVSDGVADSVNFAVRESIQVISAPGELTYELGKAMGLDSIGESIGASFAESHPAPDLLIDLFG